MQSVTKIVPDDLSRKVYVTLKEMILDVKLKPGEKIIQEKIAEELGVSRMPLHRAFQMLENDMLVEQKPRRGFYVRSFEKNEILEVFECREVLEGLAARKVALRKDNAQIAEDLTAIFDPYLGLKKINSDKYRISDRSFHLLIMEKSENGMLQKLNSTGHFLLHSFVSGLIREPLETLPEHFSIIEAIKVGDPDDAEKCMRQHSRLSLEKYRIEN
jgi:GntR family transcriptional regulator, vanillate catabolism transcriptional regulator